MTTRDATLLELLCTCFDGKQLHGFLQRRFGAKLLWTLPDAGAPRMTLAQAACEALERQGLIDGALFAAIAAACPRHRAAATTAAAEWGIAELPEVTSAAEEVVGGALGKLRGFARSAHDDAAIVVDEGEQSGSVALADVYVERTIERSLLAEIEAPRTDSLPILIVGGAGVGKTSLLWRLSGKLKASGRHEPWMLKASALRTLATDDLAAAIEETGAAGHRPIVLFDTVDLLLHDEAQRDHLLALLMVVDDLGCTFVMACRPGEVQFIPGKLRGRHPVPLGNYDDDELRCAFDRYIARFHGRADIRGHAEHHERLAELAAAQRELCTHPLTLRMMFVLYTPGEVPPTLDLAGLYDDFWRRRVREDLRAGMCFPADGAPNLEEAAGTLALAMLSEGVVSFAHARAVQALRDEDLPAGDLAALVDRGIVRRTEDGSLEFFHQSFFEHAAARGAIQLLGAEGISLLREQVVLNPSDLLLTAVIEQALTLSQAHELAVQAAATRLFETLFDGQHDTLSGVAVAVYARMHTVDSATVARAEAALRVPLVADRFIETLPSIPPTRRDDLFSHLTAIWRRAIDPSTAHWGNCLHILDELPRLAAKGAEDARRVRGFLAAERILQAVLDKPDDYHGTRKLLVILAALAPHDAACWDDLVVLCRQVRKPNSQILAEVLATVARQARWLRRPALAREIEDIVTTVGRTEESRSWGLLWAADWRARGLSLAELLDEVNSEPDERRLYGRMNGLALFIAEGTAERAAAAWAAFRAERETSRSSAWIRVVWQELLDETSAARLAVDAAVMQTIGGRIAAWIGDDPGEAPRVREMLVKAVRQAGLPECVAGPLLASERLAPAERWQRLDDLGHLLPLACLRGHTTAVAVMERMVCEPRAFDPELIASCLHTLVSRSERAPHDVHAADLAVRLGLSADDAGKVGRVMKAASAIAPVMRAEAIALRGLAIRHVASRKSIAQHEGAILWHLMIGRGLVPLLDTAAIEELVARLGLRCTRSLLPLVGDAAPGAASQRALGPLLAAATAAHRDVRRRQDALESSIAILRRERGVRAMAATIVDLAFQPPTDAGLISVAMWTVADLVPEALDIAAGLLRRLARDPVVRDLGEAARRSLRGTLRRVMRLYVAAAAPAERKALLALAREATPEIASLFVDAACREAFAEVEPELVEMSQDPSTPADVKRVIELQRPIRHSPKHRSAWTQLTTALAARRSRRRDRGG